jgi:leucyl aminopeptidase (aminopeptidase T)
MPITKIYQPSDQIIGVAPSDLTLGQRILSANMGLISSESLLIVTDPQMEKVEGALWFASGQTLTQNIQMVVFDGMKENAEEPPAEVSKLMGKADVIILQTSYSLSHTNARRSANKFGARIASLPSAKLELIRRTLNLDYSPVRDLSNLLVTELTNKTNVSITNPAGTNLTLSIKNRNPEADTGFFLEKGSFGNLPAGETMLAPVEGGAQGVFVVEGAFTSIPTDQPIKVTVKNGQATDITGGLAAQTLYSQVKQIGPLASNVAELGIGTNPGVNPQGSALEAEKTYGTVHRALGNNVSYGGTVMFPSIPTVLS